MNSIESTDKKHFSLSKTVSLLDPTDNGQLSYDEFWTQNVLMEVNNVETYLSDHLNADLPDDVRFPLKCSSEETDIVMEPMRRISISLKSTCAEDLQYTFDRADVIDTGTSCLGTPVKVVVDIENLCEPFKYKMALKSVLLNGEVNLQAVSLMFLSNYPNVILLPNIENKIKIMMCPLMPGQIDVNLELVSEDEKKHSNIIMKIRIIGENPKLKLEYPEKAEINFELVAESSVKNIPLLLKNTGTAQLPIRFLIFENSKGIFCARTVIEAFENFQCDVCVTTLELPEGQSSVINLTGMLIILLDTSKEASLEKCLILQTLKLSAQVGKTSILVNNNAPLTFACSRLLKSSSHFIDVANTGMVPLDITVTVFESGPSEFLIEPRTFQLLPQRTTSIKTVFKPLSKEHTREVDLYLSFDGSTKKYVTKIKGIVGNKMDRQLKFVSCAAGIFIIYFYYGIIQEKITRGHYGNEKFSCYLSLVLVQCVVNYFFALFTSTTIMKQGEDTTRTIYYLGCAVTYLIAMFCSNIALQWVTYPTQVIGKSAKPIPVMILGVLLGRKVYPFKKYCFVFLVVIGIALFMYKDNNANTSNITLGYGEVLIFVSLLMDGLTAAIQERMRSELQTKSGHLMLNMNKWSSLILGAVVLITGDIVKFFNFAQRHPAILWQLFTLSVASAFGQFFIFITVVDFGPLPCSIVTTTRKFFTVLASVIIFDNVMLFRQWLATLIVFAGLFLDIFFGKKSVQTKKVTNNPLLKNKLTSP